MINKLLNIYISPIITSKPIIQHFHRVNTQANQKTTHEINQHIIPRTAPKTINKLPSQYCLDAPDIVKYSTDDKKLKNAVMCKDLFSRSYKIISLSTFPNPKCDIGFTFNQSIAYKKKHNKKCLLRKASKILLHS